eukprot:jgi/Ulvmu1/9629/UM054_0059.1
MWGSTTGTGYPLPGERWPCAVGQPHSPWPSQSCGLESESDESTNIQPLQHSAGCRDVHDRCAECAAEVHSASSALRSGQDACDRPVKVYYRQLMERLQSSSTEAPARTCNAQVSSSFLGAELESRLLQLDQDEAATRFDSFQAVNRGPALERARPHLMERARPQKGDVSAFAAALATARCRHNSTPADARAYQPVRSDGPVHASFQSRQQPHAAKLPGQDTPALSNPLQLPAGHPLSNLNPEQIAFLVHLATARQRATAWRPMGPAARRLVALAGGTCPAQKPMLGMPPAAQQPQQGPSLSPASYAPLLPGTGPVQDMHPPGYPLQPAPLTIGVPHFPSECPPAEPAPPAAAAFSLYMPHTLQPRSALMRAAARAHRAQKMRRFRQKKDSVAVPKASIRYASRKRYADSRPRVHGRFISKPRPAIFPGPPGAAAWDS